MSESGYDKLAKVGDRSASLLGGAVCAQYTSLFLVLVGAILIGRLIHPAAAVLYGVAAVILGYKRPLAHTVVDENNDGFEDMSSYLMIALGVIALAVMLL